MKRGMPLYELLKKTDAFVWIEEAQKPLESLKASLTSAPILIAPERGESLLIYIVASNHVVSAALIVEREEPGHPLKVPRPVYFVGEVLTDAKVCYPPGPEASIRHFDGDLEASPITKSS